MASRVGPTPVEMESGEREMISAAAELFRERLRARIGDGAMVVWFGDGIEIDLDPLAQRLQVTVPTNFFR
ncbi:MAG: hypothetical protein ACKO0V_18960, partial [bacterium]